MKNTELKDWIPLISKLVYPIIALIIVLIYSSEISDFYNKKIMDENSDVKLEVAGFGLEIKQKAKQTIVGELGFSNLGLQAISNSEFHPNTEEDANNFVTKSTSHELKVLIESNTEKTTFETLILVSRKQFSLKLLRSYINQLGIKYVVFIEDGEYLGLIESKLFINQFFEFDRILGFNDLLSETVGKETTFLRDNSTVLDILKVMNEKNLSQVAIVDEQKKLSYIVEREAMISKLVASIITETENKEENNANKKYSKFGI